MKKIEFQAGPVSCSVNPLSFDDKDRVLIHIPPTSWIPLS